MAELSGNENSENEVTNQAKNKKTKKKKSKSKSEINNDTSESLEPLKANNKSKGEDEIILTNEKKKSKKKSKVKLNHPETTNIEELLEVHEPGDIVKTRSKEDISTLNKNLKEGTPQGKLGKKKKIKQDRIENDLFEDDKENITKTKVIFS